MQGITKDHFELTENIDDSNIIVINICTVKGDDVSLSQVKKIVEEHPYKSLIIAGCIPLHMVKKLRKAAPKCGMITTSNIDKILEIIEETINENPFQILSQEKLNKTSFSRVRKNKLIGIIPISNSCLGNCTYCSVKAIKGDFYSFPEEEIIDDIKKAVSEGCKEIWLTSQDNGCYGKDIDSNLVKLLERIITIEGKFHIRLGMMNPNQILPYIDDLVEVMKNPKFFRFVHIPVQSGSDEILKKMNRKYTSKDYKTIIKKFKEGIPNINVATDVIVGFPEESGDNFEETINLVKETQPDSVYISKYRRRPKTKAYKMKQVDSDLIKTRVNRLNSAFEWGSYENNKKWIGWEGVVLIDEEGKDNTWVGRNIYYKPIIIPKGDERIKLGTKVKVKIKKCTNYDLRVN